MLKKVKIFKKFYNTDQMYDEYYDELNRVFARLTNSMVLGGDILNSLKINLDSWPSNMSGFTINV